jgi:hypothetical protein
VKSAYQLHILPSVLNYPRFLLFRGIWYWGGGGLLQKSVEEFQIWIKSDKHIRHFTWRPMCFILLAVICVAQQYTTHCRASMATHCWQRHTYFSNTKGWLHRVLWRVVWFPIITLHILVFWVYFICRFFAFSSARRITYLSSHLPIHLHPHPHRFALRSIPARSVFPVSLTDNAHSSALKMDAAESSETWVAIGQITRRHVPNNIVFLTLDI